MAVNLIDMFSDTVGEPLIKQASGALGESAESTTSAVGSIASTLLEALINSGGTDAGARDLMNFLSKHKIDGSQLSNVNSLLDGGHSTDELMTGGTVLLNYLLGDKLGAMMDVISGSSGLKTSSASSLLKIVAPLFMGVVGKYIKEKSIDGLGVKSLLLSQREFVKPGLPKGMEEILGLGAILGSTPSASTMTTSSSSGNEQNTLSKLLPWIVLLLTSLGLFYFVQKGCGPAPKTMTDPVEVPKDTLK